DGVLTAEINLPAKRYPTPRARSQFQRALLARLGSLPGVSAAAVVTPLPFSSESITMRVAVPGRSVAPAEQPRAVYYAASPDYFRAMRIPLRRGRLLDAGDTREAPPVALVNETFAARVFPGEDAIGKRVHVGVGAGEGAPHMFDIPA